MSAEQPFDTHGEFYRAVLGQNGFRYLVVADAETAADEEYCALQALTDAAVTATVAPGDSDGDTSIDFNYPSRGSYLRSFYSSRFIIGYAYSILR